MVPIVRYGLKVWVVGCRLLGLLMTHPPYTDNFEICSSVYLSEIQENWPIMPFSTLDRGTHKVTLFQRLSMPMDVKIGASWLCESHSHPEGSSRCFCEVCFFLIITDHRKEINHRGSPFLVLDLLVALYFAWWFSDLSLPWPKDLYTVYKSLPDPWFTSLLVLIVHNQMTAEWLISPE